MNPQPLNRREFLPASLALGGLLVAPPQAAAADAAASAPTGLATAPVSQGGLSPRLTMHAIDIHHGTPGAGMKVELSMFDNGAYRPLKSLTTNRGGRNDDPLLIDDGYRAGRYEVLLHVDQYFAALAAALPSPTFLSKVALRFVIRNPAERIHLAILFTPWSYSYYRGS